MPIYEYRCEVCGHQEEFLQKVSEPPIAACPACGKKKFRKLLSAAGFQLKGSGWYATDFKAGGKSTPAATAEQPEAKAEPKPESRADAKPGTKAEAKSDSKPAAKPATKAASTTSN